MPLVENSYWRNPSTSLEFMAPEGQIRDRVRRVVIATAVTITLIVIMIVLLIGRAFTPPLVISEASDGWPSTGSLVEFKEKRFTMGRVFLDIVREVFTRTEKGYVPVMAEFVEPELLDALSKMRPKGAASEGFAQSLLITDIRPVGSNANTGVVRFRGLLTVLTGTRSALSDIMVECRYERGRPTPSNVLGWRLVDIRELAEDVYFSSERQATQREKFNPGNLPSMQAQESK